MQDHGRGVSRQKGELAGTLAGANRNPLVGRGKSGPDDGKGRSQVKARIVREMNRRQGCS